MDTQRKFTQTSVLSRAILSLLILGATRCQAEALTPLWEIPLDGRILASPTVGKNGAVYIGTEQGDPRIASRTGRFYSISAAGATNWVVDLDGGVGTAAVGDEGTIYVGSWRESGSARARSRFQALRPDGTIRWVLNSPLGAIHGCPAVGLDGTVYFAAEGGGLFALSADGSLQWTYSLPPYSPWYASSSPVIGPDGTIYLAWQSSLHALRPDGVKKWTRAFNPVPDPSTPDHVVVRDWNLFRSWGPAVGGDGVVYLNAEDDNVYAVNPDGTLKWTAPVDGATDSSPVIGPNGTVYSLPLSGILYAISPDGESQPVLSPARGGARSTPAIALDGSIYLGTVSGTLYQRRPDATLETVQDGLGSSEFVSAPAILPEGVLYVGSEDGRLFAIQLESGAAQNGWTMFRANAQRTGRAVQRAVSVIQVSSEWVRLRLLLERDQRYALESSSDLRVWHQIEQVSGSMMAGDLRVPRSAGEPNLYYRLRHLGGEKELSRSSRE